jgi:hypothetical protein
MRRNYLAVVVAAISVGCSDGERAEAEALDGGSDAEVLDDACGTVLDIETDGVRQDELITPSEPEVAADALDPNGAELSEYGVVAAVEQRFINRLNRTVLIEEAGAALTPEGAMTYDADYRLSEPIELGPHETKTVEFFVTVGADEAPGFMLAFVSDAAVGVHVAPYVRVTVPGTDNCGHPDGVVVHASEGEVEIQRPVECGAFCEILFNIILNHSSG